MSSPMARFCWYGPLGGAWIIVEDWVVCGFGMKRRIASVSRRIPFFGMLFCGRAGFFVLITLQKVLRTKTSPCQKRLAARPEIVATAMTRPAFLIIVRTMSWMTSWLVGDDSCIRMGIRSPATGPVVALMIEKPGGGGGTLDRAERLGFWEIARAASPRAPRPERNTIMPTRKPRRIFPPALRPPRKP